LLGEGKLQDAQTAAAKAIKLSQSGPGQAARYEAAFADARVQAKSGKTVEARKELEAVQNSTHKLGYRLYEYQARLAIGEIELWSGSPTAGAYLAALEKDAREHGAGLVADQTRALRAESRAEGK
jgi:hypothetical protein